MRLCGRYRKNRSIGSIIQGIALFLTYPQLRTNKQVEQTEAKPVETNEAFQEKINESKESNDDENEVKNEIQEEPGHVVRTYILVGRPG